MRNINSKVNRKNNLTWQDAKIKNSLYFFYRGENPLPLKLYVKIFNKSKS